MVTVASCRFGHSKPYIPFSRDEEGIVLRERDETTDSTGHRLHREVSCHIFPLSSKNISPLSRLHKYRIAFFQFTITI